MPDLANSSPVDVYFRFESFKAVNTDVPAGGAGPNYYGFINIAGQYYIMREVILGDVTTYDYYAKLTAGGVYATDWAGRSGLTYSRYDLSMPKLG